MVNILQLQCFCPPMVFQFPADCSSTSTADRGHVLANVRVTGESRAGGDTTHCATAVTSVLCSRFQVLFLAPARIQFLWCAA